MDDQLNDDTTCGSVDSNTRGITITPRVDFVFFSIIEPDLLVCLLAIDDSHG
jgi:hypothetical protein